MIFRELMIIKTIFQLCMWCGEINYFIYLFLSYLKLTTQAVHLCRQNSYTAKNIMLINVNWNTIKTIKLKSRVCLKLTLCMSFRRQLVFYLWFYLYFVYILKNRKTLYQKKQDHIYNNVQSRYYQLGLFVWNHACTPPQLYGWSKFKIYSLITWRI